MTGTPPNPRIGRSAVFVGCARDSAPFLPAVLGNLGAMAGLFVKSAFIFVENDSRDETKQILDAWCSARVDARRVSLDGLSVKYPLRTLRLAAARNEYLRIVKSEYQAFDLMVVLDCDDANRDTIELEPIVEAVAMLEKRPDTAGIFSNSSGFYYDLWALRQEDLCPNDIWEDVGDYVLAGNVPDKVAYEEKFQKRLFHLEPTADPIEVESAFGGLGIYKIASILRNASNYVGSKTKLVPNRASPGGPAFGHKACGWQLCEHVSFNLGFRKNNEKLLILPSLINRTTQDNDTGFVPSFWKTLLF